MAASWTTQSVWLFAKQTERQSKWQTEQNCASGKIIPKKLQHLQFQCFNLGWHK